MKKALNVLALVHTEWNRSLLQIHTLAVYVIAIVHQLIFTCRLCPQVVHQLLIIAIFLERS